MFGEGQLELLARRNSAETEALFKMLNRFDNVALAMLNKIDPRRETSDRVSYYDGYAGGVRDAAAELRRFVLLECPEFHERLIAPKSTDE